jgi:DNA-directed RNA polymerase subunit RPC12/RpoP
MITWIFVHGTWDDLLDPGPTITAYLSEQAMWEAQFERLAGLHDNMKSYRPEEAKNAVQHYYRWSPEWHKWAMTSVDDLLTKAYNLSALSVEYVQASYRCPSCDSDNVESVSRLVEEHDEVTQRIRCNACGKEWEDVYLLAGIREL